MSSLLPEIFPIIREYLKGVKHYPGWDSSHQGAKGSLFQPSNMGYLRGMGRGLPYVKHQHPRLLPQDHEEAPSSSWAVPEEVRGNTKAPGKPNRLRELDKTLWKGIGH